MPSSLPAGSPGLPADSSPLPAFRHDPVKSVLPGRGGGAFHWDREPAVCAHRRLTHDSAHLGQTVPVPVSSTPAVVAGVGVVVASDDGRLRFFDPGLGKVYWERRLDRSVYASLVVDQARRHVIVATTSGLITCFDLRGTLVWSRKAEFPVFATPTVLPGADLLVVAGFHSRCLGLALGTGELVYDRPLPRPWSAAHGGVAAYRDPYASPVPAADDTAVLCCGEHVVALAADGTEVWRQEIGHPVKASPALLHETGRLAVCPVDGRCVLLDAKTGRPEAEVRLGAKITGSPAVSGDVLAVGTQLGTVTGLTSSGEMRWTSPQGAPRSYTSLTVLPDGNFVATAERGNIVCLAREDGRFLWESSQVLGLPDHEPALDITPIAAASGSMYAASYGGDLYQFLFQPCDEE
ncbi:PQQ-binding-like beta-propeller repeat protein [Streptomyces olivaceoviridis]|uniref:outer membrane protein assembly factor BamB family protein n=1 Tax=Streptomyces olivaceoviridis TaxID=1921 RepID=UPI00331D3D30